MNGLTPKQEAYARGVLFDRKTKRQAYRDAYPKSVQWKDRSVDTAINNLEKNKRFIQGFEKMQSEAAAFLNITRDDVLIELWDVGFSRDPNRIKTRDKLTALGMIIDMMGWKNAQKVELDINSDPDPVFYLPEKDPEPE